MAHSTPGDRLAEWATGGPVGLVRPRTGAPRRSSHREPSEGSSYGAVIPTIGLPNGVPPCDPK